MGLEARAKQAIRVLFRIPNRLVETDPFKQVADIVGWGHFVFSKDDWRPGKRVVHVKNLYL
jgi:peptide/nickel transport system substrate-binding protein